MSTASPRLEVISTGMRSLLTCSINGKSFFRASLAVTAIMIPPERYKILSSTASGPLKVPETHLRRNLGRFDHPGTVRNE